MIYCNKNGKCIAKYGHQQRHCSEAITDRIDQNCHYWHYPDICGVAHLIPDDQKIQAGEQQTSLDNQ